MPPDDPPPTWIDEETALTLLRDHRVVTALAKRLDEAGEAGFVGATHEIARVALRDFGREFLPALGWLRMSMVKSATSSPGPIC